MALALAEGLWLRQKALANARLGSLACLAYMMGYGLWAIGYSP